MPGTSQSGAALRLAGTGARQSRADAAKIQKQRKPSKLERVTGIEPVWVAWKATAQPLGHTRLPQL